jgi:hypothetical protein
MTLRKCEDNADWKRKQQVAICRELAVEEAMNLSYGELQNE